MENEFTSRENIVEQKSEKFAIKIVKLYKHLCKQHKEYDLFKQILRSGTSVGANIAESEYAISDKDFLNKMHISLKECKETKFWINLLYKTDYLSEKQFLWIYDDCIELIKILTAITKTLSEKLKK